ncbi:unnamed protein product [Adineta steineri]|uniref:Uncharacterized protein n=1 Tax=Adineta steineri TaxID=433720 RepID=A0A815W5I5_9BILA|nr:unnamed protein product [Adineta steineri]
MGNYLQNFRRDIDDDDDNEDDDTSREIRRRAGWFPVGCICCCLGLLFVIAVTIICSLIPLFLSKQDVNAAVNNGAILDMVFATDLSISSAQIVTNGGSLTSQFYKKMGYANGVLTVKSISLETGSITASRTRKRQLRNSVSCSATQAGSSVSESEYLRIIAIVNMCPKTKCKTAYCFTKCVPEIKADILAKLGSTSFSTVTNLGSYIVSSRFCGFDQVVSEK